MLTAKKHKVIRSILRVAKVCVKKTSFRTFSMAKERNPNFFGKWQENMSHVNHHHFVHICIICKKISIKFIL
jgi:hypothetical protein